MSLIRLRDGESLTVSAQGSNKMFTFMVHGKHLGVREFTEPNNKECPRCNSRNIRSHETRSHDNQDDEPLICDDCGYRT